MKKPAIRHAEKRRTSTCRFADRIAQVSVAHYNRTIPVDKRPSQTCVATILAHYLEDSGGTDSRNGENKNHDDNQQNCNNRAFGRLWVLSMGVGTKFLSESSLRREIAMEGKDGYGSRVRDMHAEVLARRAFRRQLTLEIQEDLRRPGEQEPGRKGLSNRILIRSMDRDSKICYKLRPGVTLHMYTSSAPCGNSTLKRFCKMAKEKFLDDLGPDEWPKGAHDPPPGHSIKLGEFSLLLKKDNSDNNQQICTVATANEDSNNASSVCADNASLPSSIKEKSSKRKPKPWPATLSDDWAPPGTTIVGFRNKGSIHTCSDKICRWNYLGMQGSLLAGFMEAPIYMSTLTVGRKLSGPVCRRAVCCRLDTRCRQPNLVTPSHQTATEYRVNHPAVMGTSVYLDTGVVDTSNVEEIGQDVRFHSSFVWAWWAGLPDCSDSSDTIPNTNRDGILECIESSSGTLVDLSDEQPATEDIDEGPCNTVAPQVSTKALTSLFLQVYHEAETNRNQSSDTCDHGRSTVGSDDGTIDGKLTEKGNVARSWANSVDTLSAIREVKTTFSPIHEEVKDRLFAEHRVLSQWRRRGYEDSCTKVNNRC
eukprot:jgi/Psemu1/184668/e_gw1.41.148.1